MNPIICGGGYQNRPLTKEQKSDNRKNPRHVALSSMYSGLGTNHAGLVVRTVGLIRAKANVALTSLVYNISRYTQIIRLKPELLG